MGIATKIRWKIAGLLCAVALVNFFQRTSITVAGDSIMKDFHFTQTQLGSVFSAFVLGYTLFQVPGGMLADRLGPRKVLGWAMFSWCILTFLCGMIGKISLLTGLSVLNALIALRFVFGISQAPIFPTSTRTVANWFPSSERALANGVAMAGISIASFLMPPLISWMVLRWSWQSSFSIAATFSLPLAIGWMLYVRDYPSQHVAVNAAELNAIRGGAVRDSDLTSPLSSNKSQLGSGNLWLLVTSYTLYGYVAYVFVFWFFLYLKQVRHFGQTESAWLTTVAWILATITTLGAVISPTASLRRI